MQQHEEVLRELGYYGVPVIALKPIDGTNDPPDDGPTMVERMKRIPFDENYGFLRGAEWEIGLETRFVERGMRKKGNCIKLDTLITNQASDRPSPKPAPHMFFSF